jgi:sugar transferase (PEP-CTERM/EpsH1 system associated)
MAGSLMKPQLPQNRPIRVMHVVDVLSLAGMEYGVIKLVNRLDPDRVSSMICCLRFQREATRSLLNSRIPVFELQKPPGRNLQLVMKLAALLRRNRVDIVHSHNWSTFLYTVLAAALARVPILIHGAHGRENQTVPRLQLLMSRWLATRVTRVVSVSSELSRELVTRWKISPARVSTIVNGVDPAAFDQPASLEALRQELQLSPDTRVVMNIGGLRPVKDHPTLLRAFARIHEKLPETRLLIVGTDMGRGIQSDLEKLAEELGIRKVIQFTGVRTDVPQLLALCDVYVNSSVFEGMSNTILEAMAARKPVIATAVGGNPELVQHGVTGFLVPPKNDQQLAERLEQLLTDPALSRKLGSAGRGEIERHYTMSRRIHAHTDLYQELFSRRRFIKAGPSRERMKQWTARAIHWSGLTRIRERVRPNELAILTYHRVLPLHEFLRYPFQGMATPRDLFEAQMGYLARRYAVLEFPEAMKLLRQGQLPPKAVVVTFDDGYQDNYEHAWPILKKYGIPATIFLATGALDRTTRLWWDEVAEAVQRLPRDGGMWSENGHGHPDWMIAHLRELQEGTPHESVARAVVCRMNALPPEERQHALEALRDLARPSNDPADLMLTWEQVQELHRSGVQLGSHTVTHAFLDEMDEEGARREILGSVQRLEEQLKVPVRLFSYPRGRVAESVETLLREAGIEAAVTTKPGRNTHGSDLLRLKRIDAGYCSLPSGFDRSIFEAELQGWFNRLRQEEAYP